jgi:probable HAF family extracellular repeat protein
LIRQLAQDITRVKQNRKHKGHAPRFLRVAETFADADRPRGRSSPTQLALPILVGADQPPAWSTRSTPSKCITGSSLHAAYWDGIQTTVFPTLESGPTSAHALNSSNVVVGDSYRSSILNYRAVMWTGTTMTDLGALTPTGGSSASAINDAGVVVGMVGFSFNVDQPGRWEAGTWTALTPLLGNTEGGANDINNAGVVVGYSTPSPLNGLAKRATMWVSGQAIDLGSVDGRVYSDAYGLNSQGDVVGDASLFISDPASTFAFVYSGGQMYDLTSRVTTPGWFIRHASAINDLGQIVGVGQYSDGTNRAVLLTPVPEPSSVALVAAGLVGLTVFRRRMATG